MVITVEFTGAARAVCGKKVITLDLPERSTYRDAVREIGRRHPELIGLLIDQDGETFLSANMFVIDGDLRTPAMLMDDSPKDGSHLILMSLVTGG